ncbi:MAG: chorismate mutase [Geminicoccaceae bacterium]
MAEPAPDELSRLRAEIDRLDDAVVDLLLERIAVVRRIGEVKTNATGLALRPSREADLIRRLTARAAPALPPAALTRMWRELLATTTRMQTPFKVAVLDDPAQPHVATLARDQFGTTTPLVMVETVHQGFRLIATGEAELLVVPAPTEDSYWWRRVTATLIDSPLRVVSRLPFCPFDPVAGDAENGEARAGDLVPGALVLGGLVAEPSSADLTLVAIETDLDLSRARQRDLIAAGGVDLVSLVALRDLQPESAFFIAEVAGMGDAVLAGLGQAFAPLRERLLRLDVLGSYPRPLGVIADPSDSDA